jgi:hypothetical protein
MARKELTREVTEEEKEFSIHTKKVEILSFKDSRTQRVI